MKKLLLCFLVSASLIACSNQETKTETAEQKSATVEHIFKPTYTDNFKIGGEGNVLLVEKFHQAIFAKDFKQMGEFLADTAIFNLDDGTVINGKDSMVKYAEKNFSKLNIINYNQLVSLPVVADNGHEWVLVWDEADLEVDGKSTKVLWQDAFRVSNGKIVVMNGFAKYPK
jgi:predicted SnoaL-like aldol condensation-catalyzing enzyme